MFMKFVGCDGYGIPTAMKYIINMKTVNSVSPLGRWVNSAVIAGPIDPSRAPRVDTYSTDVFEIIPNALILNTGPSGYENGFQVVGDFDEIAEALANIESSWG